MKAEGGEMKKDEGKEGKLTTIKGVLKNDDKYAPYIGRVYLTNLTFEQETKYAGKNVEVTGYIKEHAGDQLVDEKGVYSAGMAGPYTTMTVTSIKLIE